MVSTMARREAARPREQALAFLHIRYMLAKKRVGPGAREPRRELTTIGRPPVAIRQTDGIAEEPANRGAGVEKPAQEKAAPKRARFSETAVTEGGHPANVTFGIDAAPADTEAYGDGAHAACQDSSGGGAEPGFTRDRADGARDAEEHVDVVEKRRPFGRGGGVDQVERRGFSESPGVLQATFRVVQRPAAGHGGAAHVKMAASSERPHE